MSQPVRYLNPEPRYSDAAIHGQVVYLAGQVPTDPDADMAGQTLQVLEQIDALLAGRLDAGFVLSHDIETISFACREMMAMGKPVLVLLNQLGYMEGFPPAPDKLVDNGNRTRYPQMTWSLQHVRELLPTRNIRRGPADYPIDDSQSSMRPLLFNGVGGSTVHNLCYCFRTPEPILEKWRRENGLRDLSYADLVPSFRLETAARLLDGDALDRLRALFADDAVLKVGHNLKYDIGVLAQHGLDELLRDAVRQLGRAPRARHPPDLLRGLRRGGQAQARQFVRRETREVGDVGRVVGRQAQRADLRRDADAPEVLHGARLRGVGLRVEGGGGFGIDHQARYIAQAQLVGQHQPAGAGTGNEHIHANVPPFGLRLLQRQDFIHARLRCSI